MIAESEIVQEFLTDCDDDQVSGRRPEIRQELLLKLLDLIAEWSTESRSEDFVANP